MLIPQAAVTTVHEYRAVAERCLYDEAFAETLIDEQTRIARELSDPERLWYQIFDCYREWLDSSNAPTTDVQSVLRDITDRITTRDLTTVGRS